MFQIEVNGTEVGEMIEKEHDAWKKLRGVVEGYVQEHDDPFVVEVVGTNQAQLCTVVGQVKRVRKPVKQVEATVEQIEEKVLLMLTPGEG